MFKFGIFVTLIIRVFYSVQGQSLSFCENPIEGQTCQITCTTPDHTQAVSFLKTSTVTTIGTCSGGTCGASPPFIISQPTGTTTLLTFTLTRNDAEEWQCDYGSLQTTGTLKWGTYPTSITANGFPTSTTITTEQEVDVKLECLYSESPPTVTLYHTSSASISTSPIAPVTCTSTADVCTDPDFTTYTCKVKISPSDQLDCSETYSLGVYVKISNVETVSNSSALGSGITYECGNDTDDKSCDDTLIYVLFFILNLVCVTTTFFLVIWFNMRMPNIGKVVFIIIGVVVNVLVEVLVLWGIEYGSDFMLFMSDINCPVVIIGVVCHVVAVVVEIVKAVIQYLYIEELGARIFVCCLPGGEKIRLRTSAVKEHPSHTLLPANGDDRKGSSADNQSKTVAKPEDIILFMHFTVPVGYTVNKWVTEENASIENNPKYVSNDRGTLLIKSATEKDNGIYQGILTSDRNEQRVNAVLHVTGQKSANLIINPLIWRQVRTKKLKKISDLKEIRHKVSRHDIGSIPTKNEDESNVSIRSIRWVLNGKIAHTLSNFKNGDDTVPPHTVTKNQPIDEYHCTVEFSNKKSHVYIFIVKFTGVRSGNTLQSTAMHNNKVDTVDDVVGVPTILITRREETTSILPPLSSSLEE